MVSDPNESQSDEEDDETSHIQWPVGWGAMLVAGWLVFEFTAQPCFGVAVTCTKLMWDDLKTGLWWLKRDPWRQRGVCGMTLLVIRATAKYAFTLMALGFLMLSLAQRGNPIEETTFTFTVFTGGFALTFWMVAGLFITFLCVMGGVRLWIDNSYHESRRRDQFPPECHGWNQTGWLLLGTRLTELVVGGCFAWAMTEKANPSIPVGIAIIAGGVILVLIGQYFVSRRIIAGTPEQCWQMESRH